MRSLYSGEAEQSVLGGLMLDNTAWIDIDDRLSEEDFYCAQHRLIFSAIRELAQTNQPFDILTICEKLKSINQLEGAGDEAYLFEIANYTPSVANIISYAKIVKEWSERRKLIKFGEDIIDEAQNSNTEPAKIANTKRAQLGNFIDTRSDRRLRVINVDELLRIEIKPRRLILSPWLGDQNFSMVHALRGVGKTHFSLGIGYAVASGGSFLNWRAPEPQGVLYVDGEMPVNSLQERLARIINSRDMVANPENLKIITPDFQEYGIPDLATKEGQQEIEKFISEDIKLIIIDNLSCLVRSGRENESESWSPLQEWALRLRAKGKSVLFIHHSNKSGTQRGTSRKEDVLDTVICLRRPKNYTADQGALFEVHFEKSRHLFGKEVSPFEAQLTLDTTGQQIWVTKSLDQSTFDKMVTFYNQGVNKQKDLAEALGVDKSTISRHINRAREMGVLNVN